MKTSFCAFAYCRVLLALGLAWGASTSAVGQVYSLTDLGVLPSHDLSFAESINESGQVVGWSAQNTTNISRGVLWQQGTMTDLGDLPGGLNVSLAEGINNAGEVVGGSGAATGIRGFHWQHGTMTDLGILPGGQDVSFARDINDHGQVVGEEAPGPFLWENGVMTSLPTLPGGSGQGIAFAINNHGQAVGSSWSTNNIVRAVMWGNETITDLGELPGGTDYSTAYGLNDLGQVVGRSHADAGIRAFLWNDGTMHSLGTLPGTTYHSAATAINNHGVAVGYAYTDNNTVLRAVIWNPDGVAQDLTELLDESGAGWVLEEPRDINDYGKIVGRGRYNGTSRAVLLTVVPEPSTWILLLSGVGFYGLLGRVLRKRPR